MTIPPQAICPQCGAVLLVQTEQARCLAGHIYPIVLGCILDLIPTSEQDKAVSEHLLAAFEASTYAELIDTPSGQAVNIPETVLNTYRRYVATAIDRSGQMTQMFRHQAAEYYGLKGAGAACEIGCGRGGNLPVLSKMYEHVVGLDSDLPSLILAEKFLDEHGGNRALLIHGYGQSIPFPDNSFDYVTAINVLEHVMDVEGAIAEIQRILVPGGIFVADSRNRFDLLFPEPHVQLRWVGLLPRRWAKAYVRWRRGMDYSDTQLLSYLELSRVFKKYFEGRHKILCAQVSAYGYPPALDAWVDRLNRWPLISQLMRLVFPSYLVVAQKSE